MKDLAVGVGTTYSGLDFRGLDVVATGGNNGGIATVTISQQTFVTQVGISTSVVGGAACNSSQCRCRYIFIRGL